MAHKKIYIVLTYCIAAIWLINGLFCKILNMVPRHQQIVATILGPEHAGTFTFLIGIAEIGMSAWILSGLYRKLNAITQMIIIASMNMLEFIIAPQLLLWGRLNIVFALLLIAVIYYKEFYLLKKYTPAT